MADKADKKQYVFGERKFLMDEKDIIRTGGGKVLVSLNFDSPVATDIAKYVKAAYAAEYIQTGSVYAGRFTDEVAFVIGYDVRDLMEERGLTEEEAIDEVVSMLPKESGSENAA